MPTSGTIGSAFGGTTTVLGPPDIVSDCAVAPDSRTWTLYVRLPGSSLMGPFAGPGFSFTLIGNVPSTPTMSWTWITAVTTESGALPEPNGFSGGPGSTSLQE